MSSGSNRFPIVGVGASAGGIPAMEGLFKGLPDHCGLAFVIVTHLSPERESLLHEVVGRYTDMPVTIAADEMLVESEHVYVMPQNAVLTIENGRLSVRRLDMLNRERKPIDIFFSALAEDQGEYAVGIILSGGDSDGTLGAKAIKERGGLTIAQASDGYGPRNPDMPQSAISKGLIDIAVSAEQIGDQLVAFARGFGLLDGLADGEGHPDDVAGIDQARQKIYALLRNRAGHDFSGYKTKTFLRRVKRRMQLGQFHSLDAYIDKLRQDPVEVMNLFRDLLINVTNFFRDADAFEMLEKLVIPRLFEGKTSSDAVRIWVPGCATGEEVFSIGMLMREHMDALDDVPRIQIFATDIDDSALTVARSARYPAQLLAGLSEERKNRFFSSDGESYVLNPEVRELCIFSPHSVIKDPPFSRMDMVSCRNLLIYFGPDAQNRAIPIFHYSLKPNGYLFLGTSESIGRHGDLFTNVDKKQRIFQAREHVAHPARLPLLIGQTNFGHAAIEKTAVKHKNGASGIPLRQSIEAHVLERFSPAHVVVDEDGDTVYYSLRTGRYLEPAQGVPSRQLLQMARLGLRLDLRSALREASTKQQTVIRDNISIEDDAGSVQLVRLTVEPLNDRGGGGDRLYLVLFETTGPSHAKAETDETGRKTESTADLERELRDVKERLQSTVEEYETALEEVKSSNEELVSVNEEAQSTNEELEASKEEMQSLNEELSTINAELGGKIEELDRSNSDLRNLFESTQIATVFLDRDLVVRTYTPTASAFFNLRSSDIGRPLTELSSQLDYPDMHRHIHAVFETGKPIEHHLAKDKAGRFYQVRLVPYQDKGNRIQGVVVTLTDVTPLAEAEEHQKVLISELNHRVKNMLAVVGSITNRTLEKSLTKEEFADALTGRLQAMSRGYGLIARENWTEASIVEMLMQELEPFGTEHITIEGPDIKLKPKESISLSMVVHELATNAAKYGALSVPSGRLDVRWTFVDRRLDLEWRERNGPRVEPPIQNGFGLELLNGEIAYRLGGKVDTDFQIDGLVARLSIPLN